METTPSAFNAQGTRIVVITDEQHDALWEKTTEILRGMVPAEAFKSTEDRMNGFKAAKGTVLLFEDQDVVKGLQEKFALYKDNFPIWSEQTNGMVTFALWTLLTELNVGANLQHYNPLIDEYVQTTFNVPANWKLRGQLVFGGIQEQPQAKEVLPLSDRVKIVK